MHNEENGEQGLCRGDTTANTPYDFREDVVLPRVRGSRVLIIPTPGKSIFQDPWLTAICFSETPAINYKQYLRRIPYLVLWLWASAANRSIWRNTRTFRTSPCRILLTISLAFISTGQRGWTCGRVQLFTFCS